MYTTASEKVSMHNCRLRHSFCAHNEYIHRSLSIRSTAHKLYSPNPILGYFAFTLRFYGNSETICTFEYINIKRILQAFEWYEYYVSVLIRLQIISHEISNNLMWLNSTRLLMWFDPLPRGLLSAQGRQNFTRTTTIKCGHFEPITSEFGPR